MGSWSLVGRLHVFPRAQGWRGVQHVCGSRGIIRLGVIASRARHSDREESVGSFHGETNELTNSSRRGIIRIGCIRRLTALHVATSTLHLVQDVHLVSLSYFSHVARLCIRWSTFHRSTGVSEVHSSQSGYCYDEEATAEENEDDDCPWLKARHCLNSLPSLVNGA